MSKLGKIQKATTSPASQEEKQARIKQAAANMIYMAAKIFEDTGRMIAGIDDFAVNYGSHEGKPAFGFVSKDSEKLEEIWEALLQTPVRKGFDFGFNPKQKAFTLPCLQDIPGFVESFVKNYSGPKRVNDMSERKVREYEDMKPEDYSII